MFRFFTLSFTLAAGLLRAANPACQVVLDTDRKMAAVPVHIYATTTAAYTGGKVRKTETIYLKDRVYFLENGGAWRVRPFDRLKTEGGQDRQNERIAAEANTKCQWIRDENVNGEPAVVYRTHYQTLEQKVETQFWISKARGLPLLVESEIDVGAGKNHKSMRYEYKNVEPPAGVK